MKASTTSGAAWDRISRRAIQAAPEAESRGFSALGDSALSFSESHTREPIHPATPQV
jgi:hypothetical protein